MADHKEELSNFSEEVLGVNFRSFKTIRDLILRPNKVFHDFQDRRGSYTPTLRLTLFFVGLSVAMYYFFGGIDNYFLDMIKDQGPDFYATLVEDFGEQNLAKWISVTSSVMMIGLPFTTVIAVIPLIWILRSIDQRPSLSTRTNIIFGASAVAAFIGLAIMAFHALGWVSYNQYSSFTLVSNIAWGWIVIYRGGKGLLFDSKGDGIQVATVFTIIWAFLNIVSTILLMFGAGLYAAFTIQA